MGMVAITQGHAGCRYVDHPPHGVFDATLLRIFPSLQDLNFIQIGANDGKRFDPIHQFVVKYNWRGMLVEPVPVNFRALQATYAGNCRLILLPAAVDTVPGQRVIYHIREDAPGNVPEWVWGLASFDRPHLLGTISTMGWTEDVIAAVTVPVITWSEIWQKLPVGKCDVLVIDTEGHDIRLLRAANLAQHRPKLIQFEHTHVSEQERMEFYRELIALGYDLASDRGDTVAWLVSHT